MKPRHALAFLFVAATTANAQFGSDIEIDNGRDNHVIVTQDVSPTNVLIGVNSSNNRLIVDPGVGLGAGGVFVGDFNTTSNNSLILEANSAGVFGDLVIGGNSTGNAVVVNDGAGLETARGLIGYSVNADGNTADISGNGAYWLVGNDLVVGLGGASNELNIEDGGGVFAGELFVGVFEGAEGNAVRVDEGVLDVTGRMVIGDGGSSNELHVTKGSYVSAAEAWVGASDSATGNVAMVTGAGSVWRVTGALTVGATNNTGNVVSVGNQGSLEIGELKLLGSGNRFELNDGGTLSVSNDLDAAAAGFAFGEGAALRVGGELSGWSAVEGRRLVELHGTNGLWNAAGVDVTVGASSSNNTLRVSDGAGVIANAFSMGVDSNAWNNLAVVSGADSEMLVADLLTIGGDGSGNALVVSNGGHVAVGSGVSIIGSNNVFSLASGGSLMVSNDFNAAMTGFEFGTNSSLEVAGALTGVDGRVDGDRVVRLNGGAWDATSAPLVLESGLIDIMAGGQWSSTNVAARAAGVAVIRGAGSVWTNSGALTLSDGGFVVVSNGAALVTDETTIGGGAGNNVWLAGAGSEWANRGDFTITGMENQARIFDDALLTIDGALNVGSGGSISLEKGGRATADEFAMDGSSTLYFDSVASNTVVDPGPALIGVNGAANLESGATITYNGAIEVLEVGVTNSRKLVSSDTLIVGGVTNAVDDDLDALNGVVSGTLLAMNFYALDDDLYAWLLRQRLADSAGFDEGSQMADVADEIDDLATAGDQRATTQLGILAGMNGATQNAQLTQLYDRSAPSYAHLGGMMAGMLQTRERGVMPDAMWPVGVSGPHFPGDQAQVWARGHGDWGARDSSDAYSGYKQSIYGLLVGFDKSFGDLLAGVGGGYAASNISMDDGDESVAGTGYGLAYASWGSRAWFADGSVAFGVSSVEQTSGTAFNTGSDFSANQFAYALHGGKELIFRNDTFFLTPEVGIVGGYYGQEAYTENATTAVPRAVDAYDYWSFRSEVGLRASWEKTLKKRVMTPRARLAWLHEFNADEQQVGYTLSGGSGRYTFGMQAPVADLIEAGVGLSFWRQTKKGNAIEWAFDADGRMGDGYTAIGLNARWLVQF